MAHSAARVARRVLQRQAALFLAWGKRAVENGRDNELHAMRIAGKRLRYNLEFFTGQLGASSATAIGLMALMQDRLGAIADADTMRGVLDDIAAGLPADDARRRGIDACIAASRATRERAIADLHALWKGSGHSPYPDMLAASVAASLESSRAAG